MTTTDSQALDDAAIVREVRAIRDSVADTKAMLLMLVGQRTGHLSARRRARLSEAMVLAEALCATAALGDHEEPGNTTCRKHLVMAQRAVAYDPSQPHPKNRDYR